MGMTDSRFLDFEKDKDWKTHGGVYGGGQILSDNYRWLVSFYVFGFHVMFGRSAYTSPFLRGRLLCWLTTGHRKETNDPNDPKRRWWCRSCGTVWPE